MTESPELWPSPFGDAFLEQVRRVQSNLFIISPYIRLDGAQKVIRTLKANPSINNLNIRVLTRRDEEAFSGGHSHQDALLAFLDLREVCKVELRWLPNLHAKVYVFDRDAALVTSANLTGDSFFKEEGTGNKEEETGDVEYGVLLRSPQLVEELLGDMEKAWQVAAPVSAQELGGIRLNTKSVE